ncbi:hypothetical protein JCM9279_002392 [Rhodotorula babjevae]
MDAHDQRPSKVMAFVCGMFSAFGGFLFGYDTGYISGLKAMPYFLTLFGERQANGDYVLSTSTDSLITSILSAGTFVGAICSGYVGNKLGRRVGIWLYLVLFCAGVAMQTAATDVPLFTVGRVFAGLGVGGVSCLVPIYQSECAPKAWRGFIVSAYQWFITIGLLIAAIVVERTKDRNDASCYRIPVGIQFIWAAILAIGLFFLPESPRWLLVTGRDERARTSLARLFRLPENSPYVAEEYANIAANVHHESTLGKMSYTRLLFKSDEQRLPLRVWTGCALQALQQLSGINFIFYYGTTFFQNSGISNPFLITIATNVVNVGATVPGMFMVDKLGRRWTMISGAIGMAARKYSLLSFFAAIWGPYAWVITGEIVPNRVRGQAVSLTTGSQWLFNFAIGYSTPYLVDQGPGRAGLGAKVFFIWGGCCVVATLFAFFFIPETKGLSLEQVDILYRNSSIIKSNSYRKRIMAENLQDETQEGYYAAAQDKNAGHVGHSEHAGKRDFDSDGLVEKRSV